MAFLKSAVPPAIKHIGLTSLRARHNINGLSLRAALGAWASASLTRSLISAIQDTLDTFPLQPGVSPYGEFCDKQFAALRAQERKRE